MTRRIKRHNKRTKNRGGLRKKDDSLTSWQAVYKMIDVPGATITGISYWSKYGFVFRLDVPEDPNNSEFFGLSDDGTSLTKPIYSLIFKFSVINDNLSIKLIPFKPHDKLIHKEVDNFKNMKKEATVQQKIYIDTLMQTGKPVCPPIVDLSVFNYAATKMLFEKLFIISSSETITEQMLLYLRDHTPPECSLGLITMGLVDSKFVELYKTRRPSDEVLRENARLLRLQLTRENAINWAESAYYVDGLYALAQNIIVIIKSGILNYDCHTSNVLANPYEPSIVDARIPKTRSVLIDFGSSVNLTEELPFPELSYPPDKNGQLESRNKEFMSNLVIDVYNKATGRKLTQPIPGTYQTDLAEIRGYDITDFYISRSNSELDILNRLKKVLMFMVYLDYSINMSYYDLILKDRPQSLALLKIIYGDDFPDKWLSSGLEIAQLRRMLDIDFRNPEFTQITNGYRDLIPIVRELTEGTISARSSISHSAIGRMIRQGTIFHIEEGLEEGNESYDRSEMVLLSSRPLTKRTGGKTNRKNKRNKPKLNLTKRRRMR